MPKTISHHHKDHQPHQHHSTPRHPAVHHPLLGHKTLNKSVGPSSLHHTNLHQHQQHHPHQGQHHKLPQTKSVRRMEHQQQQQQQPPHVAFKSVTNSSTYSPPLHMNKSKFSKSRRNDPHEIPPVSCTDFLLLMCYYCCLYVFYACVWASFWMVYQATVPEKGPRFPHSQTVGPNRNGTGGSRAAFESSDLYRSLSEEQRQALSSIQCNGSLSIGNIVL